MINLTIKTLESINHQFSVEDETTVAELKERIRIELGIEISMQRLIFCGRVLSDERRLSDLNVNGKVIHLVPRPPPSPQGRTHAPRHESRDPIDEAQRVIDRMANQPNIRLPPRIPWPIDPPSELVVDQHHALQLTPLANRLDFIKRSLDDIRNSLVYLDQLQNDESSGVPPPEPMDCDDATDQPMTPRNISLPSSRPRTEHTAEHMNQAIEQPTTSSQPPRRRPLRPSQPALSRPLDLAELMDEMEQLRERFTPHRAMYLNILRDYDTTELSPEECTRRRALVELCCDVMHSLAHAYHATSDVEVAVGCVTRLSSGFSTNRNQAPMQAHNNVQTGRRSEGVTAANAAHRVPTSPPAYFMRARTQRINNGWLPNPQVAPNAGATSDAQNHGSPGRNLTAGNPESVTYQVEIETRVPIALPFDAEFFNSLAAAASDIQGRRQDQQGQGQGQTQAQAESQNQPQAQPVFGSVQDQAQTARSRVMTDIENMLRNLSQAHPGVEVVMSMEEIPITPYGIGASELHTSMFGNRSSAGAPGAPGVTTASGAPGVTTTSGAPGVTTTSGAAGVTTASGAPRATTHPGIRLDTILPGTRVGTNLLGTRVGTNLLGTRVGTNFPGVPGVTTLTGTPGVTTTSGAAGVTTASGAFRATTHPGILLDTILPGTRVGTNLLGTRVGTNFPGVPGVTTLTGTPGVTTFPGAPEDTTLLGSPEAPEDTTLLGDTTLVGDPGVTTLPGVNIPPFGFTFTGSSSIGADTGTGTTQTTGGSTGASTGASSGTNTGADTRTGGNIGGIRFGPGFGTPRFTVPGYGIGLSIGPDSTPFSGTTAFGPAAITLGPDGGVIVTQIPGPTTGPVNEIWNEVFGPILRRATSTNDANRDNGTTTTGTTGTTATVSAPTNTANTATSSNAAPSFTTASHHAGRVPQGTWGPVPSDLPYAIYVDNGNANRRRRAEPGPSGSRVSRNQNQNARAHQLAMACMVYDRFMPCDSLHARRHASDNRAAYQELNNEQLRLRATRRTSPSIYRLEERNYNFATRHMAIMMRLLSGPSMPEARLNAFMVSLGRLFYLEHGGRARWNDPMGMPREFISARAHMSEYLEHFVEEIVVNYGLTNLFDRVATTIINEYQPFLDRMNEITPIDQGANLIETLRFWLRRRLPSVYVCLTAGNPTDLFIGRFYLVLARFYTDLCALFMQFCTLGFEGLRSLHVAFFDEQTQEFEETTREWLRLAARENLVAIQSTIDPLSPNELELPRRRQRLAEATSTPPLPPNRNDTPDTLESLPSMSIPTVSSSSSSSDSPAPPEPEDRETDCTPPLEDAEESTADSVSIYSHRSLSRSPVETRSAGTSPSNEVPIHEIPLPDSPEPTLVPITFPNGLFGRIGPPQAQSSPIESSLRHRHIGEFRQLIQNRQTTQSGPTNRSEQATQGGIRPTAQASQSSRVGRSSQVPRRDPDVVNVLNGEMTASFASPTTSASTTSPTSQFDEDWLPVLTLDELRQCERNNPPEPHSDAYLCGMPSRKRRCLQATRPSTRLDGFVDERVREVAEEVADTIDTSQIRSHIMDSMRSFLQLRADDSDDYDPVRYSATAQFLNQRIRRTNLPEPTSDEKKEEKKEENTE